MLRFVQNDRVMVFSHGLKIRAIRMRYEMRGAIISDTKFTEMGWNDGVLRALRNIGDVLETFYNLRFLRNDKVALTPLSHRASWTSFADLQSVLSHQASITISHQEKWWEVRDTRYEMRGTRYEVRGASISITKFTELGWNDGVFVHIEEHQRCSGNFL